MRWIWIDRFEELQKGSHARAIKNVTLAEDHLHDHFPGFPVMPASLMLEGMAQTGGILLGDLHDFKHIVILAKVPKVTFHSWACPGDTLTYLARLTDERPEGGAVEVTATVGDRLVAEADIVFVHLDEKDSQLGAIDQKNFVFSMNLMGVMEVGRAGTGDESDPS
ncbi:MAG: beta-hydroxyacyl-ACP dehydratase [Planctomycetaceae bacterium]|jgi:3-hydroxyacyl-[acyl-carrier-protein] dehydratase|nr:beta-hydroxyacyl-ACP dehydratase [Planctomycetaceae bacterium]MDP7277074.1 3-hydroxyacyl-ACP dehydratase FabZ family protein [Planctomycetaceae bacterium]